MRGRGESRCRRASPREIKMTTSPPTQSGDRLSTTWTCHTICLNGNEMLWDSCLSNTADKHISKRSSSFLKYVECDCRKLLNRLHRSADENLFCCGETLPHRVIHIVIVNLPLSLVLSFHKSQFNCAVTKHWLTLTHNVYFYLLRPIHCLAVVVIFTPRLRFGTDWQKLDSEWNA